MTQVIFLHGASSSGKSTIAKELQARVEKPFWHISIDHLRDSGVLPMDRFRSGEFDWAEVRKAFFDGFHASLAAYANAGNNLIVEHILDTEGWLESLCDLLAGHDVLFVAVHCPLETLIEREKHRDDRPIGSAKRDMETIHTGKLYDLELDGANDVQANVGELLAILRSAGRSSNFRPNEDRSNVS